MSADRDIGELLRSLGYGLPGSLLRARAELEAQGLTHPKKARISEEKVPRVEAALAARFAVLCPDPECARSAARGREVIPAEPLAACEHCHGSGNRRAFVRLTAAARRRQVRKFVVVGGSPALREELREGQAPEWELRLVDGTERHTLRQAEANLEWADLVLVWGATELDHKVSKLYTDATGAQRKKVLQVARRGVAALLNAASEHLER
jgi:hypothetical protein